MSDRVRVLNVQPPSSPVGWTLFAPDGDLDEAFMVLLGSRATVEVDGGRYVVSGVIGDHEEDRFGWSRITVDLGAAVAPGTAITPDVLKAFPWGAMLTAVLHEAAIPAKPYREGHLDFVADDRPKTLENVRRAASRKPGRRPGSTSIEVADLARVAAIYQEALTKGEPPHQYVAEEIGYSVATAGRRIRAARDAGLIEPSKRSRGGAR